MKLIYLFFIIYVGVTVNFVNAEEISQPIKNDVCWLGQDNESGANIGIGQSFIVNKGDRISKFIMYFLPLNFENYTTDIIICDLRNSEGEVLETSSLKGVDCIKRIEATFNFTEHKNGTYIITCYLHNSNKYETTIILYLQVTKAVHIPMERNMFQLEPILMIGVHGKKWRVI